MELIEDRTELLKAIKNHFFWYHSFDLGNGEKVIGICEKKGRLLEQRYDVEIKEHTRNRCLLVGYV